MKQLFSLPVRVYYQDTDASGVVYHSKYLDFCERARTEFLREQGINQTNLKQEEGATFAVHNLNISYISPAKLDDLLEVTVEIKEVKGLRIYMTQNIYRQLNHKLLNTVEIELVILNKDLKPQKLSEKVMKKFQSLC